MRVVRRLREEGIEPIVVKGWALGRLYPGLGLRPYGDIDVLFLPEDEEKAYAAFLGSDLGRYTFDHQYQDYPKLRDRTLHDLYERSQLIPLADAEIRVLSDEDHLALVCMHFLRHGGFRPLWLCDIAMYVENLPANFQWDLCLGSDPVLAGWIAAAIELAHTVLGARIDGTPIAARAGQIPSWLEPALLKAWRRPFPYQHPETLVPISTALRQPRSLSSAIRDRWWNPIRASIWADAPFDESSRLPLQLRNFAWQMSRYSRRTSTENTAEQSHVPT